MPVTCENSDSAISSTIRDSLGNYNGITKASNLGLTKSQLSAALKQSILKTIEYVDSPPGFGYSIQDSLKAKYTVLRPSDEEKTTVSVGGKHILLIRKIENVNFEIAQVFPLLLFHCVTILTSVTHSHIQHTKKNHSFTSKSFFIVKKKESERLEMMVLCFC